MIVDDEEVGTPARAAVLGTAGYQVTIALGSKKAIDLTAQQTFDLILFDFDLPHMNGIELAVYLRKKGVLTPVLMLSGPPDVPACDAVDAFMCKGTGGPKALISRVDEMLCAARSAQEESRAAVIGASESSFSWTEPLN